MLDQITSTLGVLLDVDWQHNFKSFYETVRVKILCKDPSKIPAERLFGVGNKIYRLLIEVESLTPLKLAPPPTSLLVHMSLQLKLVPILLKMLNPIGALDLNQIKGLLPILGPLKSEDRSFGHKQMLGETTPTSVLKTHLPDSPYTPQLSIQEKILNYVLDETDGFNLLREMELLEDDDLMELEGYVDLQEDQEALVETTKLPDNLDSK